MLPELEEMIEKQTADDLRTDAEKYPSWFLICKKYCCKKIRKDINIEEKGEEMPVTRKLSIAHWRLLRRKKKIPRIMADK